MIDLHPEHARGVVDAMPIGIVLIDFDENVTWLNHHASRLLDGEPHSAAGQPVQSLGLPYASLTGSENTSKVASNAEFIGITQRYGHPHGDGAVLLFMERGHALLWLLNDAVARVPGSFAGSAVLQRSAILNRLEAEISRSRRYHNPLSCVAIRRIAGEVALTEVARQVNQQLRWVDLLGEWDRNTLVLVLPETDSTAANMLLGKIADEFSVCWGSETAPAFELGTSLWRRGNDGEQLINEAIWDGGLRGCETASSG